MTTTGTPSRTARRGEHDPVDPGRDAAVDDLDLLHHVPLTQGAVEDDFNVFPLERQVVGRPLGPAVD
jgi:hypothetical protein